MTSLVDTVQAEKDRAQTRLAEADLRVRLHNLDNADYDRLSGVYHFNTAVDRDSVSLCRRALRAWQTGHAGEPFTLEFCSGGGSVFDGLDLFGVIRAVSDAGCQVTTVITGYAGSMAGVLVQAGDVRLIRRDSFLHLHEAATWTGWAKGSALRDQQSRVDRLTMKSASIFAERSGGLWDASQVFAMMDRQELWLDAEGALQYGFVDRIV